ncbi:MAG TPA: cytochrome C oxidase subunit IV family protein [Thermoanaerobaculia bacterium]|nr:cytochrome C oxidase subunit IV family protein [Thermoanaerobaculia bacterium]
MPAHVQPVRVYLGVFLALMAFTALTVFASFVNLGPLNNFVALGIAAAKATLVILYFMHVRGNTRLVPVVILSGLFFLFILFLFLAADYGTRGWLGVPGR